MQQALLLKQFDRHLSLEKGLSPNSVDAYLSDVRQLFRFLNNVGVQSLRSLNHVQLEQFRSALHELGLSANTESRMVSSIRAFFRFLLLEKIIDEDPSSKLVHPRKQRKVPEILTTEEIERMLEASLGMTSDVVVNKRNHAMIEWLYATGTRVSELIQLQKTHLHLEDQYIRVRGKGNKERLVPIHENAIDALQTYWREMWERQPSSREKELVFLNRRLKGISRNMVYMMLNQCAERAGVDKKTGPHIFRHSFASHLIERGADIRVVQELLGHASILTTEIYTHFEMKALRHTLQHCHPVYITEDF
ncbi:MAG TPA: site-specific tyrosine recombinase/integron integrase [Saprospiraceae bacterium]|nr:site-specific tyrosine recombinase/integron integrase [Saprospiraceae bacterium]